VAFKSSQGEAGRDLDGGDALRAALEPLLHELDPRSACALRLRLGLEAADAGGGGGNAGGGAGLTVAEVAKHLGVTHQRASQLLQAAVGELRARLGAAAAGGDNAELLAVLEAHSAE
jgi:DNA-directed RNA polymerase sigma subunit (sigma70/sigma32)